MATVEKSIIVDVPVRTAYDQWTQFEEFPRFMSGVESVKQLDDKRLHWVAEVFGKRKEWDAEILEQTRDRIISWKSTSGAPNNGTVTFMDQGGGGKTKIDLRIDFTPEDPAEKAGDWLGVLDRQVDGDLKRFKDFIEKRGAPTGAWRGEIHGGRVEEKEEEPTTR
jgi:uncharacterized membrane protein